MKQVDSIPLIRNVGNRDGYSFPKLTKFNSLNWASNNPTIRSART